jgi:NAD(P)-dependent dehydrogenase (short-subunit alcohol dehydrogenase family)
MPTDPSDATAIYPSLRGKRVLVTGGGSGIGAGIVEAFAEQGAAVTFLDIAEEESAELASALAARELRARFERVDLTDIAALQAAIARHTDQDGPFDILVNNAANDDRHAIEDVTEAYFDDRVAVNLKHMFFAAQAVIPGMRERGSGAIVNLGSISWHLGLKNMALYQMCKAAIEGLTRSLARDLGGDGIRAVCVLPGAVRTPRQLRWYPPEGEKQVLAAQALRERLDPEHVAAMVLFLASDEARLATGHNFFIDAGWR